MALVAGHGNGAGKPRVEVLSASDLPVGVPWQRPDVEGTPTPPPAGVGAQNADPAPDLPPRGVSRPGAPPAVLTEKQLFPTGKGQHAPFVKGNQYARLGGLAKKDVPKMLAEMGIPDATPFKKFKTLATSFLKFHTKRLARDVGGGECGPAPSMMVKFAAFQAASGEYLYREAVKLLEKGDANDLSDATQLFQSSSKLQNSSRQNLLAAHELCAKEALSRRNGPDREKSALDKAFG